MRLAPDTIIRLERAAQQRFITAEKMRAQNRPLAALYIFGYCAEICLTVASYRSSGFSPNAIIDRDTRQRRMAQARQMRMPNGEPLMNSDPHPLVGWARYLQEQRRLVGNLTLQDEQRLNEAVNKAVIIYRYWRPELRYKVTDIDDQHLQQVRQAAKWMLDNQGQL